MKRELTLRSSSMPQLFACSPSELNPENFPEVQIEIEAAELGTLVHEFAQRIVVTGDYSLDELHARRPDDMERAELLIRNFFTIWDEARQIITKPVTEMYSEVDLVDNADLHLKLTGHIDVCQIGKDEAYILDYKTGRLHDNHFHQIAAYAYLVWDKAGLPEKYAVKVSVVYLEDLSVTNYDFTAESLLKWRRDVIQQVNDTRYTVGKKCAFCKIQGSCPAYREYTAAAIKFFQSPGAQKGKVKWMDVEPEERGSLLDVLYVTKKGIERVEQSLRSAMYGRKGNQKLDIGKGMVYTKIVKPKLVLDMEKALPLLRRRFRQELLDEITTMEISDVLALAASFAAKGTKRDAKEQFLELLKKEGAVVEVVQERFEKRPKSEIKLESNPGNAGKE